MHSVHAIRWIENLKDTQHELFWYDVTNKGKLDTLSKVYQFENLRQRKVPYIKGEYFLSKKLNAIYQRVRPFLEVSENEALENIILEINPDVVHSFEMQSCSYPILKTMQKFSGLKWIYSCWGNDLFYFKNFKEHNSKIKKVLSRINYLHTDCFRDFYLAENLGFNQKYLGMIPGGGGYHLDNCEKYKMPINERKIILVKGYHNTFGRGLMTVKALENIVKQISDYQVVIFGAHNSVIKYIEENNLDFSFFHRHELSQEKVLEFMGKSLIYIGNNISDGMPNTLLESIIMGAFPIQSNPGNATAEIIENNVNGILIKDPEDVSEIQNAVIKALSSPQLLKEAFKINNKLAQDKLDYQVNNSKIISIYNTME